jgi:hypothetical protein
MHAMNQLTLNNCSIEYGNENLILWLSFKGPDVGMIIMIDVYKLKNIESII